MQPQHYLTLIAILTFGVIAPLSAKAQINEEVFPDKVQTHIGELEFDRGVPTRETSEKLYYELDYHRAVQAYLWSLPIVGQARWRQSYFDLYDMQPNQYVYAKEFNDRSLILTANESTPYLFGWINVKEKAAIVEIPPGPIIGLWVDFWQRGLTDAGVLGRNGARGGTYVFTGPETPQDQIPYIEGATYLESKTNNIWSVVRFSGSPDEREDLMRAMRTYSYGEEPGMDIIPAGNKPGRNFQPRGMDYWETLHGILQEEPVEERDRFFMYFLKELGIEKEKPFAPDERQREILEEAVVVGEAMAKNMVFRERLPGVLRDDGWRLIIGRVEGSEPGDAWEHTQRTKYYDRFDPRARYTYEACTVSERMAFPKEGFGMGYGGMFLDKTGEPMKGENSYMMKIEPDAPVELFWAVTIYDTDTRGLITTDQQKAELGSAHDTVQANPDGSTYVFIGPEAPEGWESNWIKSVPGRGWFPYLRLYFPTARYFDQSWKFPQIEPVDFAEYAR
jgi:hypothetical protein